MSQEENKDFEMAVGSSNIMESNIMDEGENFYTPVESATEPESASETNWNVTKDDTGQLCRSCANASDYLIPIYEGEGLEHQLEFKIQKHLPIQVSSTDTLPLQLCYQCASTLIAWDSMVNSCIEADKKLRAMQEAADDVKQGQVLVGSKTDMDADTNADVSAEIDVDVDPEVDADVEAEVEVDADAEVEVDADAEADADADADADVDVDADVDADIDAEAEPDADSDDEPLIASKTKLSEKNSATKDATPLKKKILYKSKSKAETSKNEKTVVSKDGEDKERGKFSRKIDDECAKDRGNGNAGERKGLQEDAEFVKMKKAKVSDPFADHKIIRLKDSEVREIIVENEKSAQSSLICHVCAKEFQKMNLLQAHIRRVHERKVVAKCEVCGREFRDISNYISHMKIHSGIKSYVCQYCGKSFAQVQGLKIHQRAHTKIFPHVCLICGRAYRTKQHLDDHSTMHTDERPFECGTCGKFFRTKVHLKSHSWTHSDKFRYYCKYCQKGFNNSSHLKYHVNNLHKFINKEGC